MDYVKLKGKKDSRLLYNFRIALYYSSGGGRKVKFRLIDQWYSFWKVLELLKSLEPVIFD